MLQRKVVGCAPFSVEKVQRGQKQEKIRTSCMLMQRGYIIGGKQSESLLFLQHLLHSVTANNLSGVALGQRFEYTDKGFSRMLEIVTES